MKAVSHLSNLRSSLLFGWARPQDLTSAVDYAPLITDDNYTLDFNMSDTFYVTPASELEKLDDWKYPLAFQAAHHHETLNVANAVEVEWRLRDRV
jgi:hypothetical protein